MFGFLQNPQHWPLIEPLPSYGSGRERPGRRHNSLLHGEGLVDVWITGNQYQLFCLFRIFITLPHY